MGLVAHPVFKTGRAEQPSAWKVRFLRRSVHCSHRSGLKKSPIAADSRMGHRPAPDWETGMNPLHHLVASRAVVPLPSTRRVAARLLVAVLALCLLLPASGSASSGQKPSSAAAPTAHATKKKKRKHKRCKRYRKVRVKRGHHYRTVRRCVHKKKHKKQTATTAPAPIAPAPPAGPPGFPVGMVSGPPPAGEAAPMPNLPPRLAPLQADIGT